MLVLSIQTRRHQLCEGGEPNSPPNRQLCRAYTNYIKIIIATIINADGNNSTPRRPITSNKNRAIESKQQGQHVLCVGFSIKPAITESAKQRKTTIKILLLHAILLVTHQPPTPMATTPDFLPYQPLAQIKANNKGNMFRTLDFLLIWPSPSAL